MVGVFVDDSVRRQGVGVALVGQVVSWAQARGWTRLIVWITSGNEPAIRLYRRCRFQFTGTTRPSAHSPSLIELEMARPLDASPDWLSGEPAQGALTTEPRRAARMRERAGHRVV